MCDEHLPPAATPSETQPYWYRREQGAETTASENRPPATPHVTQCFDCGHSHSRYSECGAPNTDSADGRCSCQTGDDYSERAPLTDGHGEPVDEQRRRLPDTPEARVGRACRIHDCNDPTDDSGSYCAWHGPEDLAGARDKWTRQGQPRATFGGSTEQHARNAQRSAEAQLDELRYRITPRGFNALRTSQTDFVDFRDIAAGQRRLRDGDAPR